MLKRSTSLLLIIIMIAVGSNVAIYGQPKLKEEEASTKTKPDLKDVLAEQTKEFNARSATFDPIKVEREKANQTTKKGWTKNEKVFLGVFIVGMVVLVALLIKYGKDCIRSSPAGCTPTVDENCVCEEYEQSNNRN